MGVDVTDVTTRPLNVQSRVLRVLLIDDDVELGELVREYLDREGFAGTPGRAAERLSVGDIDMDLGRHVVSRAGTAVELTAVEFSVLELLLRAAGSVVRREELARGALGRPLMPFDRSIDVHVSRLRKKLGPGADGGERIRSLRAVGYSYTRGEA